MFIALATRVREGLVLPSSTSLFGSEEHFFQPFPLRFPEGSWEGLPDVSQRCPAGCGAFLPSRARDRPIAWTRGKSCARVSSNEETMTSAPAAKRRCCDLSTFSTRPNRHTTIFKSGNLARNRLHR